MSLWDYVGPVIAVGGLLAIILSGIVITVWNIMEDFRNGPD